MLIFQLDFLYFLIQIGWKYYTTIISFNVIPKTLHYKIANKLYSLPLPSER